MSSLGGPTFKKNNNVYSSNGWQFLVKFLQATTAGSNSVFYVYSPPNFLVITHVSSLEFGHVSDLLRSSFSVILTSLHISNHRIATLIATIIVDDLQGTICFDSFITVLPDFWSGSHATS